MRALPSNKAPSAPRFRQSESHLRALCASVRCGTNRCFEKGPYNRSCASTASSRTRMLIVVQFDYFIKMGRALCRLEEDLVSLSLRTTITCRRSDGNHLDVVFELFVDMARSMTAVSEDRTFGVFLNVLTESSLRLSFCCKNSMYIVATSMRNPGQFGLQMRSFQPPVVAAL